MGDWEKFKLHLLNTAIKVHNSTMYADEQLTGQIGKVNQNYATEFKIISGDTSKFSVDNDGNISVMQPLDYKQQKSWKLQVEGRDYR